MAIKARNFPWELWRLHLIYAKLHIDAAISGLTVQFTTKFCVVQVCAESFLYDWGALGKRGEGCIPPLSLIVEVVIIVMCKDDGSMYRKPVHVSRDSA